METTAKKPTCVGCIYAEHAKGIAKLTRCVLWKRLISPTVTEACIYKESRYQQKGDVL